MNWGTASLSAPLVAMDDSCHFDSLPETPGLRALSLPLPDVMPGSEGQEERGSDLGRAAHAAPHTRLGREDVLGCLELIVFGTFCVCRAANSGAICLCSQPQSPGINKFSSVVLKESFSGGGERREVSESSGL